MAADTTEWTWLDAQRRVDQSELAHMCRLGMADIDELVDYGALVPLLEGGPETRQFSASWVPPLREAARLRAHYDLDLFTVSLLLGYLRRISHLEQQLRGLQAHLPHPLPPREGPTPWREPHA